MSQPVNLLCVSRFFKGSDFIISAADNGCHVYLLTSKKLEGEAWPRESIADTFYLEEDEIGSWNREHMVNGLAYTMRRLKFDILVALDDFDVEHVAFLREYFRIPGMGETTARYFRDKLAMRKQASDRGIPVPAFSALFHDEDIHTFTNTVAGPWLVKPRMQASAAGIKKILNTQELWAHIDYLGDTRHEYLIEQFRPGTVFHVDSLSFGGKVLFARASAYLDPPFDVAHGGGIFRSCTLDRDSEESISLCQLNEKVLTAFGMQYSACHTEFIKSRDDGSYYFLETSSRVGGANLAEMVASATGIHLWKEWAKLEIAAFKGNEYTIQPAEQDHAGIIISLSSQKQPDVTPFTDPEIVWRLEKDHHIGLIVKSSDRSKILQCLEKYTGIIQRDYHASMPAKDRPVD